MIKQHSWTRQQYDKTYSAMRRLEYNLAIQISLDVPQEIIKAADYSYQAKDHFVTGWTSGVRFDQFYEGIQSCKHSTWSIPF